MIDCRPRSQRYDGVIQSPLGEPHAVRQEKFLCECIVCSFTAEYDVHCRDMACPRCDGAMRRLERPGPGQPRRSAVASPEVVVDTYEGILATVLQEYIGSITRKELEYNGAYKSIPVSDVPIGSEGLVHIYGRYQAVSAEQMAIRWTIRDPDGIIVESYYDADTWPYTPPGSDHHFIGGRFGLSKPGTYTIKAELLMGL